MDTERENSRLERESIVKDYENQISGKNKKKKKKKKKKIFYIFFLIFFF